MIENLGEGFWYPGGFLGILLNLELGICGIFVAFVEFFVNFSFLFQGFWCFLVAVEFLGIFWCFLSFWWGLLQVQI